MHLNLQFLCNFNDQIGVEVIEPEALKRVWQSEWKVQYLPELLKKWSAKAVDTTVMFTEQELQDFLAFAVELLLIFGQYNFTGPFDDLAEYQQFVKEDCPVKVTDPFEALKENGEEINPNVVLGEFLIIASEIIKKLLSLHSDSLILQWVAFAFSMSASTLY